MIKSTYSAPIQIRFSDIDKLGHVNNAVYLSYMEQARMHFFSENFGKIDWSREGFILAKAEVNFMIPIFLEDHLNVEMWVSKFGNKSFEISYEFITANSNGKKIVKAEGSTVLVCFDYSSNQSFAMPENWKEFLQKFDGREKLQSS